MRIAQVAPLYEAVPPRFYGGTERIVAHLTAPSRSPSAPGLPLKIAAKSTPPMLPTSTRSSSRCWTILWSIRGEIGDKEKSAFLGNAQALLFPIDWPEPFGLVMIEAMACGTPVVAWRCGSVPRSSTMAETGFIVATEDEAVAALARLQLIDRRRVRDVFEHRFTATVMARNYLRLYWRLYAGTGRLGTARRQLVAAT